MAHKKLLAQNWLRDEFPNKNTNDNINLHDKRSDAGDDDDELSGELVIDGYVNTKQINLERKNQADTDKVPGKITKVVIKNCPNLEQIDLDQNEIEEVIFEGNSSDFDKLQRLDLNRNKLKNIDVSKLRYLVSFDLQGNASLSGEDIRGIENFTRLSLATTRGIGGDGFSGKYLREWKDAIKKILKITSDDLPSDWLTDLTSKLDGKNLKDMQVETGQTLAGLISNYSSDKNNLQNQLNQAQKELDKKKDYDAIKAERDQLKQQLAEIVNKLGLASGATDKQVKDKITELMNKPSGPSSPTCSHTDYDSIKSERDRLSNENTQLKDEKKKLKEKKRRILSNLTNLEKNGIKFSEKDKEKIENAGSAEKTEEVKSEIIGSKFNELKGKNDNSTILNIGLGVLAIGSLLILGWVLMRQTNLPQVEPDKEKKK